MKALIIKGLYKAFQLSKKQSFYALNNINLSFDECGFYAIIGKSGSGKTTLLNMISCFDKPTKGDIYLFGKKYDYKKSKQYLFYRNIIGMISQQYNLLSDQTVIENVMMPLLVSGYKKDKARSKAIKLLEFVNIKQELYNSIAGKLSGGEQQRVAIARSLIRNPKIILCDEPTGALDSENSIAVMELLTEISKKRLVIMVSHNLQIVEKYSDRIIEISDGRIINVHQNHNLIIDHSTQSENYKGHHNWTNRYSFKNFKKRLKRNLFVIASLSISMIITCLVVGFMNGKDVAIRNACYQQLNFGNGTISKDEIVSDTGIIKLTKSIRPSLSELKNNKKISENFNICPNFAAILPQNINISMDNYYLDNVEYTPIYSFQHPFYDQNILCMGSFPIDDSLIEVVVNKNCYELFNSFTTFDSLGKTVDLSHKFECVYINEYEEEIIDYFEYNIRAKIVGVVDELSYLNTPRIYYSYLAFENRMQESVLLNLSTYYDTKITWYDRVLNAEDYSAISSYSYLLMLKDYRFRDRVFDESLFGDFSFNSPSLIVSKSLIGFLDAAEYALFLFLGIGLIGTLLILSIISFTNYSEDRKISAILSSIGARESDIENIYVNENLYSGIFSLFLSFGLSFPISIAINNVIYKYVNVKNIIDIPFFSCRNVPLFFPILAVVIITALIYIATILPIKFSKKNQLCLELKAND